MSIDSLNPPDPDINVGTPERALLDQQDKEARFERERLHRESLDAEYGDMPRTDGSADVIVSSTAYVPADHLEDLWTDLEATRFDAGLSSLHEYLETTFDAPVPEVQSAKEYLELLGFGTSVDDDGALHIDELDGIWPLPNEALPVLAAHVPSGSYITFERYWAPSDSDEAQRTLVERRRLRFHEGGAWFEDAADPQEEPPF